MVESVGTKVRGGAGGRAGSQRALRAEVRT